MHDLFNDDGCLTAYAFKALDGDSLDELSRLEIAEHLSFCDKCIDAYSDFLANDSLISPPKPIANTVMMRIRMKALSFFQANIFLPQLPPALRLRFGVRAHLILNLTMKAELKQPRLSAHQQVSLPTELTAFQLCLATG